MERFLWIASHFSARLLFFILAAGIVFLSAQLPYEFVVTFIKSHQVTLVATATVTAIFSVILAVIGGKAGYEHVEMGRSRQWHYRNTAYSKSDNHFSNTIYWAIEFALYPINIFLIIILITGVKILPLANL